MKIKAVIIDDEPNNIELLKVLIEQTNIQLLVADSFLDFNEALDYLNYNKIDALFLDIRLKDHTGFELYANLINKPEVIFTTAYAGYAFQAIKVDPVDYLLKPIDRNELSKAIDKLINRISLKREIEESYALEKITIESINKKIHLIHIEDILYLKAENTSCNLFFKDGVKLVIKKGIQLFEEEYTKHFYRCHRSYLINVSNVSSVLKREKMVELFGHLIPVSSLRMNELVRRVSNLKTPNS